MDMQQRRRLRFRGFSPKSEKLLDDMVEELKNDGAETPQSKRQHPRRKHETV